MKNILLAMLFFFSLAGCMEEKYMDKRPAEQARFVSIVREWRDTLMQRRRLRVFAGNSWKTGLIRLRATYKIACNYNSNPGKHVCSMSPTTLLHPNTSLRLSGMNLEAGKMSEKTRFQSVVFTSRTFQSAPAYTSIKTLEVGDLIRIDGNFETLQKTIKIDSYNDLYKSIT